MVSKRLQFNCKEVTKLLQVRFFIGYAPSPPTGCQRGTAVFGRHIPLSNSISQGKTSPYGCLRGRFAVFARCAARQPNETAELFWRAPSKRLSTAKKKKRKRSFLTKTGGTQTKELKERGSVWYSIMKITRMQSVGVHLFLREKRRS